MSSLRIEVRNSNDEYISHRTYEGDEANPLGSTLKDIFSKLTINISQTMHTESEYTIDAKDDTLIIKAPGNVSDEEALEFVNLSLSA